MFTIIPYCFVATAQDSGKAFHYIPDAGLQFKKADFQWTTWAFAERLFSPSQRPSWRSVLQGMEFQLPSYRYKINGNKYRTIIFYEVDFTDNNFSSAAGVPTIPTLFPPPAKADAGI